MLKTRFPCLVLDHDDTTVRSTPEVNYPAFLDTLSKLRPGMEKEYNYEKFITACFHPGFELLFRDILHFSEEEMQFEFDNWQRMVKLTAPSPVPGIDRIISRQNEAGGKVFVVSHSMDSNIRRDWLKGFDRLPERIYAWDEGEGRRKPDPYPLLDIMEKYGYSADQMLMVDDLRPGVTMSHSAGVKIAGAGWADPEGFLKNVLSRECDYYFTETKQLEELLFNI